MAYIRTDGIITKVVNFGEADKIITIFSGNHGKLKAVAKGARRPKSRIIAGTQFLSYCNFVLFRGRELHSLNSCDVIEPFYKIRNDLVKLTYACYMIDVINDVVQENQPSPGILRLFLNSLHMLLNTDKPPELIKDIFSLRTLVLLGYAPSIHGCIVCGNPFKCGGRFDFENEGVVCFECSGSEGGLFLKQGTVKAIQHIVFSSLDQVFKFALSNEMLDELTAFVEQYIAFKLEKNYNRLDYLKQLENSF